jgi:hypothetical protein
MRMHWQCTVTVLVGLALAGRAAADFTFPAQRCGAMEAVLAVHVADHSEAPGLAAAVYTIEVRGPAGLQVEAPQLGDATQAWKVTWEKPSRKEEAGGVIVTLRGSVQQVKPVPPGKLPSLRLGLREDPKAEPQEVEWLDILDRLRELPGPAAPPEPPAVWKWAVAAGVVIAAMLTALVLGRRRKPIAPPRPPEERALSEIDLLERTALPPAGPADAFHTRLSDLVRRYLAERFGLKALEQTTAEFLAAARQVPQLNEREPLLCEFCERCDLAKFARAELSPQDCRRSADLARTLVEQLRSP